MSAIAKYRVPLIPLPTIAPVAVALLSVLFAGTTLAGAQASYEPGPAGGIRRLGLCC